MTSASRFAVVFLMATALGLVALVPVSARTDARSKYGGTLVVGIPQDPGTLDLTLSQGLVALTVAKSFCEQLYDYDRKARIVPQLAAALPVISKDKLTYTIPLRPGIRFNDGTPFNAQAVVTTLQRMITLPGSIQASYFASVDSVTASGSNSVVIHLNARFTPLTATLATEAGAVLSPTQLGKLGVDFGTDPVCVGPFMFDHRVAGDNVTLVKSPWYYDQKNVYLDKIIYKPTDGAAAAAALKAGDIQALDALAPTELPGVQQAGLRVLRANGLGWPGLVINLGDKNGIDNPLASSFALRQAFEEAIDRQTMNRVVFGGTSQPGCTPLSPASPMFDASIQCTPYNPQHAKKLVAASGFSNPTVRLLMPSTAANSLLAQFIKAQEEAVGINVVIDLVSMATFTPSSGDFDAVLVGPASGANIDGNFYAWFASSESRNFGGHSNPRLDLILANTRKATAAEALKTLYHTAQQILANDRPVIFLYHSTRYAAVKSGVTGVQLLPADLILRVAFAQYE